MIVLRSTEALVRLDPSHGGEILDLVDLVTGRQLLGRPPFPSLAPLPGPLDEDAWTDRYRGGWQTVTPNAGNACAVDGTDHGFHGTASNDPWEVVAEGSGTAAVAWAGHGLRVERRIEVQRRSILVETTWSADSAAAPYVAVEHLVLGTELLVPGATLTLPGGTAYELSETDGPARPPAGAASWSDALLLDGSTERANRIETAGPSGRFLVVADLPEGRAELVNDTTGQGVVVEWTLDSHPHLWLWKEVRASGGRWRGQAELLGLEPASVPHSLGLARALAEGQATVLAPGERRSATIRVTPTGH